MPARYRRSSLLADLTPLVRSVDYRWLFSGQLVSVLGNQLTVVAVPFQVYRLTRSSFVVGLVSLAQLFPLIGCSLVGGAFADAHDRRRLLVVVNLVAAATSGGLALNSVGGRPALWPLFLLSATLAALSGFSQPAYNAAIPNLVASEDLTAAYALAQLVMQVGIVAGPALAGVLLAGAGASTVYACDAASFVVCAGTAMAVRPLPPAGGGRRPGVRSIAEGFRYLRGRQAIQGVYLLDINAMVFGMPRALFPALGTGTFHGGASTVGYLYAAPGAGALAGAVTTGWVGSVKRQGRAVVVAVIVWGAAVAAFGLTSMLPLALALLAVAGWADVVSAVFRNTILQSLVPDRLRGRLSAVQMAVVAGGPRLGDLEAGGVAAGLGNEFSVVSGGLACIGGALALAAALPGFRHQHRDDRPPAEDPGVASPGRSSAAGGG